MGRPLTTVRPAGVLENIEACHLTSKTAEGVRQYIQQTTWRGLRATV